jgi:HK97 family phage major capsid protein
MTPREELKAKQAELVALKSRIEADDAEAIAEGEKLQAEIETKTAEIERADKKAALLGKIGSTDKKEDDAMSEVKTARTLGENFINTLKAKGQTFERGDKFSVGAPAFVKAATDTQTSPAGAVDFATTFDKNVVTAPRVDLVVRDLFGAETISGSTLVYLVEGAIQGAPAVTAEGAKKPQVHFADPTPKTVSLAKVACHIKESDEYINDYPFLASAINGRLLYELGLVEQNKLVTDLLGTSGIQSDTTSWVAATTAAGIADIILQEAMDVQQQSGFPADAIVMNPADWYTMRVAKDGEDRYYGGGFFGAQNIPNLWGIPVCVTTAVSAGTIIVGAFKACGSVVQNGGVRVEAVNTDQDDFVKNLMTIRAEERLALAVRRPAGFSKIVKVTT